MSTSKFLESISKMVIPNTLAAWLCCLLRTMLERRNDSLKRTDMIAASNPTVLALDAAGAACSAALWRDGGVVARRWEAMARGHAEALMPMVERGVPVIGLEPSCLLTLRDEFKVLLPGEAADRLAENAVLFEEFIANELDNGRFNLELEALPEKKALLHGHCHQKAFAVMGAVEKALALVPELDVETVDSSCCGMAGAFGYDVENVEVSKRMGEMNLLPAVRGADDETLIVADGTSCRHQIADGTERQAEHVASVLERALAKGAR